MFQVFGLIFAGTLIAGVLIALIAAAFGTVMLWQRLAFFGDALAHSLTLGVALNILVFSSSSWGSVIVGLIFALGVVMLRATPFFAPTTLLSIISHSLLATGILLMYVFASYTIDLHGLFFGDLLSIRRSDFWMLALLCAGSTVYFLLFWKKLLFISINAKLAQAEGVSVRLIQTLYFFLLTMMVTLIIRMTGILLVSSILVIPPASARNIAQHPRSMLLYALAISVGVMLCSILISFYIDVPLSPLIVVMHGLVFMIGMSFSRFRR